MCAGDTGVMCAGDTGVLVERFSDSLSTRKRNEIDFVLYSARAVPKIGLVTRAQEDRESHHDCHGKIWWRENLKAWHASCLPRGRLARLFQLGPSLPGW